MNRVERLLAQGFEKTRLEPSAVGGGERRPGLMMFGGASKEVLHRNRIHALERRIHVLNCNVRGPDPERQNDAAVELGVALAAWHALQGHVCSSWEVAEGKVGPSSSRMIQVGAEFETDGFALFRSRFAELAVTRKGAGTKLARKKPPRQPPPVFEYVDYAPGASSPPLWYSPDVSPRTKEVPVVTEARTPSPFQIPGPDAPTYPGNPTLQSSKAKGKEKRIDSPTKNATPPPRQISRFFPSSILPPGPSSRRVKKDPDVSQSLSEAEGLEVTRAASEEPRPIPKTSPNKQDDRWLRERWAAKEAKEAKIATSPWRPAPEATNSKRSEKRESKTNAHAGSLRVEVSSSEEGGVRLTDSDTKKQVGKATKPEAESGASGMEATDQEEGWVVTRRRLQDSAQRTLEREKVRRQSL
jgi:hypothetical protein